MVKGFYLCFHRSKIGPVSTSAHYNRVLLRGQLMIRSSSGSVQLPWSIHLLIDQAAAKRECLSAFENAG